MPSAPWNISFGDGSGNQFRFWQMKADEPPQFEYTPVTAEESSSGTYSGGSAKFGELSAADVKQIWSKIEAMSADEALHADTRMMGTGQFVVTAGQKSTTFIVKSGAELNEFRSFINQFAGE
ncbi:MAG: hypothetical protein R3E66_24520 [bacterium]